jgi:hypothetical protein
MTRRPLTAALSIAAAIIGGAPLVAQVPVSNVPTFGAVLEQARVNTRFLDSSEFARRFNSGAVENARDVFIAAFYDAAPADTIPDTLRVYVLEKITREWRVAAVPRDQRVQRDSFIELGAVMRIRHTPAQIYIDTHVSPSAGAILVLTHNLRPVTALRGWTLAVLAEDRLVYHRSMVHFAPTHSAELAVYDPRTRKDTVVIPGHESGSIRERYVELVRTSWAMTGAEWFRQNNHHMDPERFDSALRDTLVVSESRQAFAGIFVWGGGTGPARTPLIEIAVHCRAPEGKPYRCIEEELSAARQRAPGLSDTDLLLWLVRT